MRFEDILVPTPRGLCCPLGGFHIDPVRPVERALITHGHSDHARPGHQAVLATSETLAVMSARLGEGFAGSSQAVRYGEPLRIGEVRVTFLPAGHVLGSAQILIEHRGIRAVVSGDYKREADPTCAPFEPVACDLFITEATFALPVFRHPPAADEIARLQASRALFPERVHLLGAYTLGKAQRLIALLREGGDDRPIHLHGALEAMNAVYAAHGIDLGELRPAHALGAEEGGLVICPPSALADRWTRRFGDARTAFASGWMRVRARARQRGVELPLVVSDHADWDDLCRTIEETGAGEVWVTHGQEEALVHWCATRGIHARPLHLIGYGDEGEAEPVEAGPAPDAPPLPEVGA